MLGSRVAFGAVLVLLGPLAAWGQPRTKVAVMPPEGEAPPALAERAATALAAAAEAGGREVVRTAVPLQEVQLTVECPEPTAACKAVAGRNLGVGEVLQTRLTRQGAGWRVEVTLFDVAGARVARGVDRTFPAEPSADEVGQVGRAVFELTAPPPPPAPRPGWRLQLRPRTWITAGAGAAVLIVGGVLGGLMRSTQHDFNSTAAPAPNDLAAIRHYVDLADKGKAYATGANVCLAVGAAALVAGGVLFYFDWHRVEIQPVAGPRAAGLMLRRSF